MCGGATWACASATCLAARAGVVQRELAVRVARGCQSVQGCACCVGFSWSVGGKDAWLLWTEDADLPSDAQEAPASGSACSSTGDRSKSGSAGRLMTEQARGPLKEGLPLASSRSRTQ